MASDLIGDTNAGLPKQGVPSGPIASRSMSPLTRRQLLAASSLSIAATAAPTRLAAADPGTGPVIAYVTDVHVDPEDHTKTPRARATADALIELDPDLVIHAGDLTEYGSPEELRTWLEMFPDDFRSRIHHAIGNHEVRWEASAYETFTEICGPTEHSVEVGGLQVIFTDPTTPQQEWAIYHDETLDRLRTALDEADGRPAIVVGHYPLGFTPYQVRNADEVLGVLADAGACAFLGGHVHYEKVTRTNGLTELIGEATCETPGFYLLTRHTGDDGDVLEVEHVVLDDPGGDSDVEPGRTPVTTIDLTPGRDGLRPLAVTATATDGGVDVDVTLPTDTPVAVAQAVVLDHTQIGAGRVEEETWLPLTIDAGHATAVLPLTGLPPGDHRVQVRLTGDDDAQWRTTVDFTIAGFAPLWTHPVTHQQAALAEYEDLVIAAAATGHVHAFRPTAAHRRPRWATRVGPVHNDPVVDATLDRIFLPSSDHHVHALVASTGRNAWRADLGAPVMSDLALARVDGSPAVLAIAGETLSCLDADDGSVRWQWAMPRISGGPAISDGERVYLGVGDGNIWALDAATGAPLWQAEHCNGNVGRYRTLIWGPWESRLLPVPGDLVLACSRQRLRAVERATGETVWEVEGHFRLATPFRHGDDVIIAKEEGQVMLLDPATGVVRVELETVPLLATAGLVVDGSTVTVTGAGGLVAQVDVATESVRILGQVGRSYAFSTPVITESGLYVVGTLSGELRAHQVA